MRAGDKKMPISTSVIWQASDESMKAEGPDPIESPEYYDGISSKRIIAYVIDFLICAGLGLVCWFFAAIIGFLSFGLLLAPMMVLIALLPIAYHTYLIGSKGSATFGMRFCGIKVYRLDGQAPEMLQAFILSAVFFFTAPATSFLILLVALFNIRRRCLHDMMAGTIILNDLKKV
jgi:uncharacterized RDD family membrane protein YckC